MAECPDKTYQNDTPNCPICIDTLKKPWSLPCLHSFCESCLGDYIASVCRREPGLAISFPCPSCRADTTLPCDLDGLGDVRKFAEKFHPNIELVSLSEVANSEKVKTCDVCCVQGFQSVAATSWCQDCQEVLCGTCTRYHRSSKATKSHKIDEIKEIHFVAPEKCNRRCPDHAMDLTFFCFSHEQPCCVKCAATKHRVCDNVEELVALLQDPDFPGKIREMQDELIRIHSDLSAVLQNREHNAARLGEQHLDIKEKVTSLHNKIVQQVERMTFDILSKVNNEREKESSSVRSDTEWFVEHQQLVSSLQSKIQIANQGSELISFLAYRDIQRNLTTLKTELPEKLAGLYESNLDIVTSESSDTILQQFSKLLAVTVKKESCKFELSSNAARQRKYDVMPVSNFKVSVSDENAPPRIRSVLFVDDDKLLMIDVDSKSLKLYDVKGRLLQRAFTRGKPGFLTRMQGNLYAVTEPQLCAIDIYELSSEIKVNSSIKAPEDILGIAFLNDVFILTCKNCVRIIDQSGNLLQHLDKNTNGNQMFSKAFYMTCDPSNNVIYISDYGNERVFAFKQHPKLKLLKQEPLHIYTHPQLRTPSGLAIDKSGNLLVCGFASGNIHLFDKEGTHLKIICGDVTKPLNLEWDGAYETLVLSTNHAPFQIQLFKTF